jgi:ABC-type sulfate transport system permease component
MMPDPDHMSQSALRFESIKRVPDPILANLRMMIAMTNTRYVMVPASVRFRRTADGVEATTVLVLADPRSGEILWRSTPVATAATAGAALAGTIAWVLPDTR